MSHRGVFFVTHLKSWVRIDCAACWTSLSQQLGQDVFPQFWGNAFWLNPGPGHVAPTLGKCVWGPLTMHGNVWRSLLPGFFANFSFWLTYLVGGEGVKQGWIRWWENAARYSQLLHLITCCPQRESSCETLVATSESFWKTDTCHQGN